MILKTQAISCPTLVYLKQAPPLKTYFVGNELTITQPHYKQLKK